MSGVIIKCPNCGRGNMKSGGSASVGKKWINQIGTQSLKKYRGIEVCNEHCLVCQRCGYIMKC